MGSKINIFEISRKWWDFEEGRSLAKRSTMGGPNCWIQARGARLRVARPGVRTRSQNGHRGWDSNGAKKIDIFEISRKWWDFEEGHSLAKRSTMGGPTCWTRAQGARLHVARPGARTRSQNGPWGWGPNGVQISIFLKYLENAGTSKRDIVWQKRAPWEGPPAGYKLGVPGYT